MGKQVMSIGDVHGRDMWKFYTHGSPYEYNLWKILIDSGAKPDDFEFWKEMPYAQVDKVIFVGDYVDSYDISGEAIIENLLEIIEFKKLLPNNVVLLIGNHDLQYIVPKQICSGFRPESKIDLQEIFEKNIDLFKMAHEETGADGSKWLWTHAGVTSGWFDGLMKVMKNHKHRFAHILAEFFEKERTVSEILNQAWEMRFESLYNVDSYSGGMSEWAGPLWVRPELFTFWPLQGYNQIVGHTQQAELWVVDNDPDNIPYDGFKIYFIDFLSHFEAEPFIVDI